MSYQRKLTICCPLEGKFRPSNGRFLKFVAVIALSFFSKHSYSDSSRCGRYLCLAALGVPCLVEKYARAPIWPISHLRGVLKSRKENPDTRGRVLNISVSTGRGPIEYYDALRLHGYDFRGKKILDIAAGKSRFAQAVNLVYGNTGTRVTALDAKASAPLFSGSTPWVKGDAFNMDFPDESFDLTLNNWMFVFYLPKRFPENDRGISQKQNLESLIGEQIRVTAKGGELRIGLGPVHTFTNEGMQYLSLYLQSHPRVELVEFARHTPIGRSIRIKLNQVSEVHLPKHSVLHSTTPLKAIQWQRLGLWGSEYLAALGLFSGYKKFKKNQMEKEIEEFNRLYFEVAELLLQKVSGFQELGYEPFSGNGRKDLKNTIETLSELKNFLNSNSGELRELSYLYIVHGETNPTIEKNGVLYLNSSHKISWGSLFLQ